MEPDEVLKFQNLSTEHLESTLDRLKKELAEIEEGENEAVYILALQIAKVLFARQPINNIELARRSVNDLFKRKDDLSLKENEFAKLSPAAIAKWRQKKYGGRI